MSNFVDFMGHKIVYKRYASLYFCCAVDQDDNELEVLEVIHRKPISKIHPTKPCAFEKPLKSVEKICRSFG